MTIQKVKFSIRDHTLELSNKTHEPLTKLVLDLDHAVLKNLVFDGHSPIRGSQVKRYHLSHDSKQLTIELKPVKPGRTVHFRLDVDTKSNSREYVSGVEMTGLKVQAYSQGGCHSFDARFYGAKGEAKCNALPSEGDSLHFAAAKGFSKAITNRTHLGILNDGNTSVTQLKKTDVVDVFKSPASRFKVSAPIGESYLVGKNSDGALSNVLTIDSRDSFTLAGTSGRDLLVGNSVATVYGGHGDDVLVGGFALFGGDGDDVLCPEGASWMRGGSGQDTFAIGNGPGVSHILDLEAGERVWFGKGISVESGQWGWDLLARNEDGAIVGAIKGDVGHIPLG